MKYIIKAFKWAYGDSLRYIAFFLAIAIFVLFLMTLLAYPVETLTAIVIGVPAILLFNFFVEVGR